MNWTRTTDALPVCDCGDRIICIIKYRDNNEPRVKPHIVVLVATETGWQDAADGGFDIHDSEWWIMEKNLVQGGNAIMNHKNTGEQIAETNFTAEQESARRAEFEAWVKAERGGRELWIASWGSGVYYYAETEFAWQAFLKAKRG